MQGGPRKLRTRVELCNAIRDALGRRPLSKRELFNLVSPTDAAYKAFESLVASGVVVSVGRRVCMEYGAEELYGHAAFARGPLFEWTDY